MKKVCHLISCLLKGDGPSNGILAQILAQDKDHFQSLIWSLYPPPSHRSPHLEATRAGANYRSFSMGESFWDVRILVRLVQQLRQDRPDILHCHLVRANLYGRLAGKLARVPVVISTLRNIEEYMQKQDPFSRVVRQVEHRTARWVSKYVANSDRVRRTAIECLGLDPDHIVTVLNAVDLEPFRCPSGERLEVRAELGLSPNDVVVGSVGRLHRQKNYPFLINVAHALKAQNENARFVIVGDGEQRAMLKAMVTDLSLDRHVLLPGFRFDVPRILQAFDIFALPSLYEGLPRSVMEAMAAGLPCVVTDVGGNAEAVVQNETGFVVPKGDRAGFTTALIRLVRDSELCRKMGQAAQARANGLFGAERMAREYADLYTQLSRAGEKFA